MVLPRIFGKFRKMPPRSDAQTPWQQPPWWADACALQSGVPIGGVLMDAIYRELSRRAFEAGAGKDWPQPRFSDLRVRREGIPDWFTANRNLVFAAENASSEIHIPYAEGPGTDGLLVLGFGCRVNAVTLASTGGIIALGDHVFFPGVSVGTNTSSTVLVGEGTNASLGAQIDSRNGGAVIVGADGLWAHLVHLMTDDAHAIRDMQTGSRVNGFGGRIILERHVWLATGVTIIGDCRVGEGSVVGAGSLVHKANFPPNSTCAGRPAKVVRKGIVWTREDLP